MLRYLQLQKRCEMILVPLQNLPWQDRANSPPMLQAMRKDMSEDLLPGHVAGFAVLEDKRYRVRQLRCSD